jgi:hypothetical protein
LTLLKSIVAALLLANVGYFLWSKGIAQTPETVIAGSATLQLASESAGAGVVQTGAAATGGDAPVEGGAPALAQGGVGSAVVNALAPPELAHPDTTAPPLLSNVKRCVSVGPFRDVSEAARAAGTLRSGGYDPRQRVADGEVWAGVWVYLPLPAAKPAAEQVLDKLKAGGIDDALEMPGPNDTSVISLGLFSEPKRAQARVAQAQALSLNPAVADRKRNGNVYWIDVDLKATDGMLNPADLQGEAGHIVRLEVKGCPSAVGGSR